MKWHTYDPNWLIELAKSQCSDKHWLHAALSKCTRYLKESNAYYYFIPCNNPNKQNSEWQFDSNIMLECPKNGTVILDILKGQRVGGIEFFNRI